MIDVPVSLVGTFAVMAALGFSLNNISLFGLVLAIGIVVDDAIVVLENIERFIALGYHPREATIKAMDEITGPILAITLVLCSVFLPAVFMPGITGQFFRQFALVISSSMIISAINAMTLTPARAVTIFKQEGEGHGHADREALPWWIFGIFGAALTWWAGTTFFAGQFGIPAANPNPELPAGPAWEGYAADVALAVPGLLLGLLVGWFIIKPVNWLLARVFKGFNKVFDWVTLTYGWLVGRSLRVCVIVLVVYGGLLFLTGLGLDRTPKGFIPEQDQG
jgi:multidrug efflux pump